MSGFRRFTDKIIPHVGDVLARFPIPLLLGGMITTYMIWGIHHSNTPGFLFLLALCASFAAALFAALYTESRNLPRLTGQMAGLIGSSLIILLGAYPLATDFNLPLFLLAISIALALAPFIWGGTEQKGFWQFNHSLWLGLLISFFAGLLFFAGVSSIFGTLKYLFGLDIPRNMFAYIGAISFGAVGPIAWLGLVPKRFDTPVIEGPQQEFVSIAVAALVKFILVPLLLVYAFILHIYALKIGLQWSLPIGRLGWMVLSFGAVVAITALMVFPTRQSGGALNRFFWRTWPLALIVPTLLLFVSVGYRISQYGLTEKRYLVVLAGIWLASLALFFSLKTKPRDLRLIPGLLAILLLFASFGPWGISALSTRWQTAEFVSLLERNGFTKNGQLSGNDNPATASKKTRRRLGSILTYLEHKGQLHQLAPLFEGTKENPFKDQHMLAEVEKRNNWYPQRKRRHRRRNQKSALYAAIKEQLPFSIPNKGRNQQWRRFNAASSSSAKLAGIGWITKPMSIFANQRHSGNTVKIKVGAKTATAIFDGQTITISLAKRSIKAVFVLSGNKQVGAATTGQEGQDLSPIVIVKQSGKLDVRLVLTHLSGTEKRADTIDWTRATFFLLFPKLPGAS